jgi:DNA-binding CsgD family transcriptional regulator
VAGAKGGGAVAGDAVVTERHVTALVESCATAADSGELFEDVSERLRRIVDFDGAAWFATDPATVLATCPVRIENVAAGHCESYWERECQVEDTLLFRDLARAATPAATLYATTDNHPARSPRYREFLAPQGYGDELRAVFRLGDSAWGVVDIFREQGRKPFSARDLDVVRAVAPAVAGALRTFATTARPTPQLAGVEGPGTALFDRSGTIVSLDEQAEHWFTELAGPHWGATEPPPLMATTVAVVALAHAVAAGRARGPAAVRLRATSGRWLSVHASCLRAPDGAPGPTALVIEPAKSAQIAPIIVEAYCLTPREQQITQAVARGLSNPEIAAELFLSAHTVRDHLKAVFAKVGVGSRGELVAKLFAEHYGPALHAPDAATVHIEY